MEMKTDDPATSAQRRQFPLVRDYQPLQLPLDPPLTLDGKIRDWNVNINMNIHQKKVGASFSLIVDVADDESNAPISPLCPALGKSCFHAYFP